MRKILLGLALLAPASAFAQTPYRGQSGYDTGSVVPCVGLDGVSASRCLIPGMILYDQTGAPVGPQNPQNTVVRGGANIATNQISVGTTSTLLVAARPGRQKVTYAVTTAVQCSYGNAGVTLTTGFPLQAVAGASQTLDTAAAIYAVCASAATVGYLEQF